MYIVFVFYNIDILNDQHWGDNVEAASQKMSLPLLSKPVPRCRAAGLGVADGELMAGKTRKKPRVNG
jgi:hypothetical protein